MKIQAGQCALVTGASRGLGTSITTALAKRGVNLIISARDEKSLRLEQERLSLYGIEVHIFACDLVRQEDVIKLAEYAQTVGIDILVNNAGLECACLFDQLEAEDLSRTLQVNVTAPIMLTRHLLPSMRQRGAGHIVNMGSILGFMATPYTEAYCTSKAAIGQFTQCLRLFLQAEKWPVSASVVEPGFVEDTGMYQRVKDQTHDHVPAIMGTVDSDRVGEAVITVIERDKPSLIVAKGTPRLMQLLQMFLPKPLERLSIKLDLYRFGRKVVAMREQEQRESERPSRQANRRRVVD